MRLKITKHYPHFSGKFPGTHKLKLTSWQSHSTTKAVSQRLFLSLALSLPLQWTRTNFQQHAAWIFLIFLRENGRRAAGICKNNTTIKCLICSDVKTQGLRKGKKINMKNEALFTRRTWWSIDQCEMSTSRYCFRDWRLLCEAKWGN